MVVLANLHGGGDIHNERARDEFREIKGNVLMMRDEGERGYTEMWNRYKKRLLIAMSSQAFAQLNGINVISYYVSCSTHRFMSFANQDRPPWFLSKPDGSAATLFL